MHYSLLFILLCSLFSCELHQQSVIIPPPVVAKKTDLSVIDSIMVTVLTDDIKRLEGLLDENTEVELNIPGQSGALILNQAVKLNRIFIGEVLLKHGADPRIEDGMGMTAQELSGQSEINSEWEHLFRGESLSSEFLTGLVLKTISQSAQDTQADTISKLDIYFGHGAPYDGVNDSRYSYLMIASSNDLVLLAQHLCTYPELDPTYTITVTRRRRKYKINAMYFAHSSEMKATLHHCGVESRD